MDTNIITVERIQEYINLKPEADWRIKETEPASNWPQRGHVKFSNFSLRYREDLELVLKGIDCDITPGEKVKDTVNRSVIFLNIYSYLFISIIKWTTNLAYIFCFGKNKIFDKKVLRTDILYILYLH